MRKVTLKDIAKELNISIGTVDRAIHGRGRISEETKKLVMQKIQEVGYKPNTIASALGKNKVTRIVFITPAFNYFFRDIIRGAKAAYQELTDYDIDLKFLTQDSLKEPIKQLNDMNEIIETKPSGIIIAPQSILLSSSINKAVESGIPVITVNLDAKDSKRICYVGQEQFKTGEVIGTIFGKFMRGRGKIALLRGATELLPLQIRTEGFLHVIEKDYPEISICGTYEYTDDISLAYDLSKRLIVNDQEIKGIFANTTFGTIGIGNAIKEFGLEGKVAAVGYDTQSEVLDLIRSDSLIATVTQNPFFQGYNAVKLMNRIIFERYSPEKEAYFTRADIIMNSLQLDLYEEGFGF